MGKKVLFVLPSPPSPAAVEAEPSAAVAVVDDGIDDVPEVNVDVIVVVVVLPAPVAPDARPGAKVRVPRRVPAAEVAVAATATALNNFQILQ